MRKSLEEREAIRCVIAEEIKTARRRANTLHTALALLNMDFVIQKNATKCTLIYITDDLDRAHDVYANAKQVLAIYDHMHHCDDTVPYDINCKEYPDTNVVLISFNPPQRKI